MECTVLWREKRQVGSTDHFILFLWSLDYQRKIFHVTFQNYWIRLHDVLRFLRLRRPIISNTNSVKLYQWTFLCRFKNFFSSFCFFRSTKQNIFRSFKFVLFSHDIKVSQHTRPFMLFWESLSMLNIASVKTAHHKAYNWSDTTSGEGLLFCGCYIIIKSFLSEFFLYIFFSNLTTLTYQCQT